MARAPARVVGCRAPAHTPRPSRRRRFAEPSLFPLPPNSAKRGDRFFHAGRAPVAQLDRALPSEGRGHRFESCRARHFSTTSEQHWPSVRTAASSGERPLAKKALTGRMAGLQAEVEQVIWRQNRLAGGRIVPDLGTQYLRNRAQGGFPLVCAAETKQDCEESEALSTGGIVSALSLMAAALLKSVLPFLP